MYGEFFRRTRRGLEFTPSSLASSDRNIPEPRPMWQHREGLWVVAFDLREKQPYTAFTGFFYRRRWLRFLAAQATSLGESRLLCRNTRFLPSQNASRCCHKGRLTRATNIKSRLAYSRCISALQAITNFVSTPYIKSRYPYIKIPPPGPLRP